MNLPIVHCDRLDKKQQGRILRCKQNWCWQCRPFHIVRSGRQLWRMDRRWVDFVCQAFAVKVKLLCPAGTGNGGSGNANTSKVTQHRYPHCHGRPEKILVRLYVQSQTYLRSRTPTAVTSTCPSHTVQIAEGRFHSVFALLGMVTGEESNLGPDSQRKPNVPQGTVTHHTWRGTIFPGTERDYWVHVPSQCHAAEESLPDGFSAAAGM